MTTSRKHGLAFVLIQTTILISCQSQTIPVSFTGLSLDIPDGSSLGVVNMQNVSGLTGSVGKLEVTISLLGTGSGGFNGDLYVSLVHDGARSVLLNRPGKDASDDFGYSDNGLQVTFADNAANGDIHIYQNVVDPGGLSLTGTWQPDGRESDPALVTSSSSRTAFLSGFNSTARNGDWGLFVADLSPGGTVVLDSWSLRFQAVPEPSQTGIVVAAGLTLMGIVRRLTTSPRILGGKM